MDSETPPAPKCPTVSADNITVLYVPEDESKIIADVCLVHGLMGHPRTTFEYGRSTSKPQKPSFRSRLKGKLKQSSSNEVSESSNACFWPFDLLPYDFPNVRILTYGYDSHPTHFYRHKTNQMNISQHGHRLLGKVTNVRSRCHGRPLIFIAHSLGGILVKIALIESRKYDDKESFKDIGDSCRAVIFFGTPHQGASVATYGEMIATIVGSLPGGMSVYKEVLSGLKPNGETLFNVNRDFNDILRQSNDSHRDFRISSFQEGKAMTSVKLFDGKVVPDTSSVFNRREVERIYYTQKNHMDMCRFRSAYDSAYDDLKYTLMKDLEYIRATKSQELLQKTAQRDRYVQKQHAALLDMLDYEGRFMKQTQIQEISTIEPSFEWVWESVFAVWLKGYQPLFWISGKPASGKSTLVDYIIQSERTVEILELHHERNWKVLYFFFDFRAGNSIANSLEGLLRNFLMQLLQHFPELTENIGNMLGVNSTTLLRNPYHPQSRTHFLSNQQLKSAIKACLSSVHDELCVFLDGLDEYDGQKTELIEFIKDLASRRNDTQEMLKICIASRPDPPFPHAFKDIPRFSMEEVNAAGLKGYILAMICATLVNFDEYNIMDLNQLAEELVEASRGVFLWARFAVNETILGISYGEAIGSKALKERLDKFPNELTEVYARIIAGIPKEYREIVASMLLLTTSSMSALPIGVLQGALVFGRDYLPNNSKRLVKQFSDRLESQSSQSFKKAVSALTGGLLETIPASAQQIRNYPKTLLGPVEPPEEGSKELAHVRTIHGTVQNYLRTRGWIDLAVEHDTSVAGHELWMKIYRKSWTDEYGYRRLPPQNTDDVDSSDGSDVVWSELFRDETDSQFIPLHQRELLLYSLKYLPRHAQTYEALSWQTSQPLLGTLMESSYFVWHLWWNLSFAKDWYFGGEGLCICSSFRRVFEEMFKEFDPLRRISLLNFVLTGPVDVVYSSIAFAILHGLSSVVQEYLERQPRLKDLNKLSSTETIKTQAKFTRALVSGQKPTQRSLGRNEVLKAICVLHAILDITGGFESLNPNSKSLAAFLNYSPGVTIEETMVSIIQAPTEIALILISQQAVGAISLAYNSELYWLLDLLRVNKSIKPGDHISALWCLAARASRPQISVITGVKDILELLMANGEDLHRECGPSGNALCSYMDREAGPQLLRGYQSWFVDLLLQKGININAVGPFGTALDIAWKHANSQRLEKQLSMGFVTKGIRHLIDRGARATLADPNGSITSMDQVLLLAENYELVSFKEACWQFYLTGEVDGSREYPKPEDYTEMETASGEDSTDKDSDFSTVS